MSGEFHVVPIQPLPPRYDTVSYSRVYRLSHENSKCELVIGTRERANENSFPEYLRIARARNSSIHYSWIRG
jgi:hypothetical protein